MRLVFEQIRVGGDRNFGYLLGDRYAKVAVLIDPSYSPEILVDRAKAQGLNIIYIINTHGHHDHINGNAVAQELTGAPLAGHPKGEAKPSVHMLEDIPPLAVGELKLHAMNAPGHADDHIVIWESTNNILFTGDVLFVGKVGGTGPDSDTRNLYKSIDRMMDTFPGNCTIWPGHDYGVRASSTLDLEKATNPFLGPTDPISFVKFVKDWGNVKKRHGLK